MPYKNPQDKRQWERENRERRNAQRRQRHFETQNSPVIQERTPDPVKVKDSGSGWKIIAGLAVGVGFLLISALAGGNVPNLDHRQ